MGMDLRLITLLVCNFVDTFRHIFAFLKDEEGQTSTEYILLVAVVALIVFKFKDIYSSFANRLVVIRLSFILI